LLKGKQRFRPAALFLTHNSMMDMSNSISFYEPCRQTDKNMTGHWPEQDVDVYCLITSCKKYIFILAGDSIYIWMIHHNKLVFHENICRPGRDKTNSQFFAVLSAYGT